MTADSQCIFCKIASGDIPAEKVFEDDACVAFLDIGPLAEGHTLLIPKQHYETMAVMPPDAAAALLKNLPALVGAITAATGCEGVNVLQNNGRAASQVVPHVHVHIIPRRAGDAFRHNWPAGTYAKGRITQVAGEIRRNLA